MTGQSYENFQAGGRFVDAAYAVLACAGFDSSPILLYQDYPLPTHPTFFRNSRRHCETLIAMPWQTNHLK